VTGTYHPVVGEVVYREREVRDAARVVVHHEAAEATEQPAERQPERVVLLAGNRDINKLRLPRELSGAPPAKAPADLPRPALLRWIFTNTMGAKDAFDMRAAELGRGRTAAVDGDEIVASFLADVTPDGPLTRYLARAVLAFREGSTLVVHGAVTEECLGGVPGEQDATRPELFGDFRVTEKACRVGDVGAEDLDGEDPVEQCVASLVDGSHCAVPKLLTEANGKRRRVYERWATPFELFRELPRCESYLRPDVTLAELDRFAQTQSDTEAALAMQSAKRKLFQSFQDRNTA